MRRIIQYHNVALFKMNRPFMALYMLRVTCSEISRRDAHPAFTSPHHFTTFDHTSSSLSFPKPNMSSPVSALGDKSLENASSDGSNGRGADDTPNTSISSVTSLEEQRRVVADVTAETFPPFDHQGVVVNPFEEEQKRDLAFKQGMHTS